jgi:hypothetical protein
VPNLDLFLALESLLGLLCFGKGGGYATTNMLMISILRCSLDYILELKIARDEYRGIKDNEHTKIKDGGISNRYKEQCSQVKLFFFSFNIRKIKKN